jgi:hypothetical protein
MSHTPSTRIALLALAISVACTRVVSQTPYPGVSPLPGTVEAEHYDLGGPNIAYFDTTPGNSSGAFRADDVDIGPFKRKCG